jgi:hypothetical protein
VATGGGDLESALGVLLAAHVGQVRAGAGLRLIRIGDGRTGRLGQPAAVHQVGEPRQGRYGAHLDPLHQRRLGRICVRNQQAPVARPPGAERGGECPSNGTQLAAQRELPDERAVLQLLGRHLGAGREQPNRYGEVEARSRLAHVRGREVHGQPLLRELEPGVEQRRADPLARLPDRPVREPHERERGQPTPDVHLDGDLLRMNPIEREGGDRGEHPVEVHAPRATRGRADATTSSHRADDFLHARHVLGS